MCPQVDALRQHLAFAYLGSESLRKACGCLGGILMLEHAMRLLGIGLCQQTSLCMHP